jgi:hypothetical protein
MKESSIQIQCFDYLSAIANRHDDLFFFSIPNEGLMTVLMAFKIPSNIAARIINHFKRMGLVPGVPDFQILHHGECFFIEFKAPDKNPNEKQLNIHSKINDCGFTVYVCRSFEDFGSIMNDYGIN